MFDSQQLRSYYDSFYSEKDFHHCKPRIYASLYDALRKKYFSTKVRILDLGCGTGRQLAAMRHIGLSPVGIDLSRVGLLHAQKNNPEIQFVQGDALRFPFHDASFDGAIAFGCSLMNMSSIDFIKKFILESLRVVSREGWVIILTRTNFFRKDISGWYSIRDDQMKEILSLSLSCARSEMFISHPRLFPFIGTAAISHVITTCAKLFLRRRNNMVILSL